MIPIPTKSKQMQRPQIKNVSLIKIHKPQDAVLDNGVAIQTINLGEQPVSRLDISFEGGRCDGRNQTVSEMLSAILREGSTKHTAKGIAQILDFHGAWLGCDASSHNVVLSLYSLNRNFDKVVTVLHDIVMHPSLPEHEFGNLKSQAINRLFTNKQKVAFLAMETFAQTYFGNESNLGKAVTEDSIDAISIDDLRSFHSSWFTPQNMRISLAGKVDSSMIATLNHLFGKEPTSGEFSSSASDSPTIRFKPKAVIVGKPDAMQSAVRIGMPTVLRSDDDYIPLRILITALGGYFGSRLMSNIREDKGYTYSISSALLGYRDNSFVSINCQCDTDYTWKVVSEIKTEIRKLQTDKISNDELRRLKTYMLSDLARTLDTPFSIADYYASLHNNHIQSDYFERQVETINSITATDLLDIAQRRLSPTDVLTVIAGDANKLRATHHES